ncbi:MAG: hypothetical protein HYZ26_11720 [Chloroflexi bacterium]|nr:hypothetical protein [Chloroflexota bacterium]
MKPIRRAFRWGLLMLLAGGLALPGFVPARAAAGGLTFGARVDLWGTQVEAALETAEETHIEWLAVDFDWQRIWPERASGFSSPELETFMRIAEARGFKVLVSLTNAPPWAMTPAGPDALITAAMSLLLARTYPAVAAIEPFPAANTAAGWGSAPNPGAYLALLRQVEAMLAEAGRPLTLAAGGLAPAESKGDLTEAEFLEALYALDGAPQLGVVSLRPRLNIQTSSIQANALRLPAVQSYEEVRFAMLQHGHPESVIWVTGFGWPGSVRSAGQQADWLERAFRLMNAQLYIDKGFFAQLNPPARGAAPALILSDGQIHPALDELMSLLHPSDYDHAQENSGGANAP